MKKCLLYIFAAFLGTALGIVMAASFAITTVSDSSMLPQYEEGDRVLSIKASGGLFGFSWDDLTDGDVVLLENSVYTETGEDFVMMKRIAEICDEGVFVLGDNREQSTDSRSRTVGRVKRENLLGKVIYTW